MAADELSMRELANLFELKLGATRDDIVDLKVRLDTALAQQREQFERYVLAAVYEADKRTAQAVERAQDERIRRQDELIKRVEEEAESDRKTARAAEAAAKQTSRMAILTAIGTFLAALTLEALNTWLKTGGH
ncbi:MAG: hypothetical protein JWP34_5111 [Massilia sp.]|nr:hypothetical protein [Massilia sp.]